MTPRSLLAPARLAGQPILRSQTDERLVDLVRAGYDPAFEAIVARYRRALLRYTGRLLNDERAEDAVQQTFLKAYDAIVTGTAELMLRPWLYRIAHNNALNALRDRGPHHDQLSESIDGVERPDQAFERRQGLRDVVASVQALPPRQRDALVLQAVEGRSYEEIAHELGVSGGSVRQLLNRARTNLRSAATAVTPLGLITRIPWETAADPVTARVAELTAGAGTGTLLAKVAAAMLVTGAVAGGVATVDGPGTEPAAKGEPATQSANSSSSDHAGNSTSERGSASPQRRSAGGNRSGRGSGRSGGGRRESRFGHGGDDGPSHDDHSGSGDGGGSDDPASGDGAEDHSGTGGGGDDPPVGGGEADPPEPPGDTSPDSSGPGSGETTTALEPDDDHSGSGTGSASNVDPVPPPDD